MTSPPWRTLLEVFDQRGARLVGVSALDFELRRQIAVMIPAGVEALHEPHAALDSATADRAIRPAAAGTRTIPVE